MTEATDFDGAWKEALELYLRPFLELCFPEIAKRIDWQVRVEFLDKELQEVVRDAELGKQRADKLVKVRCRNGEEEWLLIHIEIQSQPEARLPRRMYQYNHRIEDRFGYRVVSLVVLADASPHWRPSVYEIEDWGCRLRFEYPVCKLLDLGQEIEQLERGDNPAAIVVAAHLAAQATTGNMAQRKRLKWQLTRRLYDRGYGKEDILELYRLIDWLMVLPPKLTVAFRTELIQFEQEKTMPYVTSIERLGRQEGRLDKAREAILEVMEARFSKAPYAVRERLQTIDDEAQLRGLLHDVSVAASLEAFQARL